MSDPGGRGDATVREALGRALGIVLNRLEADDQGTTEWHACDGCERDARNLPCPCSGQAWAAREVVDAVLAALDLPARDARVRAETLRDAADELPWHPQWGRPDWQKWLRDRADAALASAGPVEPSPAAEEARERNVWQEREDYRRLVQRATDEAFGGEG